jgi:hypothetical protein
MTEKNIEKLAEYGEESLRLQIDNNLNEAKRLLSEYEKGQIFPNLINISILKVSKEEISHYLHKTKLPYQVLKECTGSIENYEKEIKYIEEKLN